MASQPERLPWQITGEPPPRRIIFFSVCARGHRARQSQSHVKYCFILIKYESVACQRAEEGYKALLLRAPAVLPWLWRLGVSQVYCGFHGAFYVCVIMYFSRR